LNTVAGSASVYTGAIVEGATGMSLTKTGAGSQTLNATHTYTGTTFVNGGFLQLNGNNLAGGLSVSNATFTGNSSFAGLATVTSGGVIAPGASYGAIGTLTLSNATASALTLEGSAVIFDLPATVTTPDQIVVTGGLVLNGTNTVILQTPATGTPVGSYTLMTYSGAPTGSGSLVFVNGSTNMGNAQLNVASGLVQLIVAAGGLGGDATFNGAGGTGNVNNWTTAARWSTGVVPSGAVNVTLAPTGTQGVTANDDLVPTYSGNLTINPGVVLQLGWTTAYPTATNALGTPGSTTIFMGAGSQIKSRNAGTATFPGIVLLGDANVSLGDSTQTGTAATFNSITGPYAFSLYTHGIGGAAGSANFTMANSFTTLNLSGSSSAPLTASAANSIGTATVNMSSGVKMIINATGAMADSANPIRINNGTLEQGTGAGVTAALSLSTRSIELNGSGGATINNANTASSSAYTLSIGGGISSTAAGAKTLTLGGANTGINTISGNIIDGAAGSIALTKANVGTWALSGANTYSGTTIVGAGFPSPAQLIFQGKQAVSPNTTFETRQNSGSTAKLVFLDDSPGVVNLSNSWAFRAENRDNATANTHIFVGNNSTANGGNNPGSTQTGSTIALGGYFSDSLAGTPVEETINITGADGYRLQLASLQFAPSPGKTGTTFTLKLNPTTAPVTIAGNVTAPMAATSSNVNNVLALDGTALDNLISGVISDPTGAANIAPLKVTKSNTSTWALQGNNTYGGTTTIARGSLSINSIGSVNGAASALGTPTSVANGTIAMGATTTAGTLIYTGTGNTSDRVINFAGTTGGATLDQSGTGLLKFTSAFTATGAGAKTLTLQGSTAGTGEIAGAIVNNSVANTTALTKTGAGIWMLSGVNTYTGPTAVSNGKLVVTTAGSGASAITIANTAGCILGVQVATANGQWVSTSNLTVAGVNSEIEIDYGATTPTTSTSQAPLKVVNLTVSGVGTLKVLGVPRNFDTGLAYPLINFSGTGPAAADPYTGMTPSLPAGMTGHLKTIANHVVLVVDSTPPRSSVFKFR